MVYSTTICPSNADVFWEQYYTWLLICHPPIAGLSWDSRVPHKWQYSGSGVTWQEINTKDYTSRSPLTLRLIPMLMCCLQVIGASIVRIRICYESQRQSSCLVFETQTETALSTMEAEYIALLTAISRDKSNNRCSKRQGKSNYKCYWRIGRQPGEGSEPLSNYAKSDK